MFIEKQYKYCVEECPEDKPWLDLSKRPPECSTNCTKYRYENDTIKICSTDCTGIIDGNLYKNNMTCVEDCGELFVNKGVCVEKCGEEEYEYDRTCYSKCPQGTFEDTTNNKCVMCDTGCSSCTKDECIICVKNYYIMVDGTCSKCQSPCLTCDEEINKCASCIDGYSLNGTECIESCGEGYYSTEENKCEKCDDQCMTCEEESTKCTKCVEGKFLNGTQCVDSCEEMYIDEGKCVETCGEKYVNGKECVETCEKYIDDNHCVETCEEKYIDDNHCVDNCGEKYIDDKQCVNECREGYYSTEENIKLTPKDCVKKLYEFYSTDMLKQISGSFISTLPLFYHIYEAIDGSLDIVREPLDKYEKNESIADGLVKGVGTWAIKTATLFTYLGESIGNIFSFKGCTCKNDSDINLDNKEYSYCRQLRHMFNEENKEMEEYYLK